MPDDTAVTYNAAVRSWRSLPIETGRVRKFGTVGWCQSGWTTCASTAVGGENAAR